jgi:valyl-tRNA synthetase
VWSWWQEGSIHRAPWPAAAELGDARTSGDPALLSAVSDVLAQVRKAKSSASRSMRAAVERLSVTDAADTLALIRTAASDLCQAGVIGRLDLAEGEAGEAAVVVELAAEG